MAMDPEPPDPSALPAPEAPTERELLEQPVKRAATAGDSTAATTAALRLYGGEVYAFLVSTAGSASLADEAYSDLCEVVWRQLCDFRWEASLRSWMYSVARKLALRHRVDGYRRQQRARPLELAPEVEALAAEIRVSTLEILRTSVKDGFRLLRADSARYPRKVVPGTYSMATKVPASSSPTSYTVTTLGCASLAMASASRRSRSTSRPWR